MSHKKSINKRLAASRVSTDAAKEATSSKTSTQSKAKH
ncbi:hypothetical protein Clole_1525 [Cellulosilyticum lentocellum DSM 5427]|uniref:Uncharacterized protein n=1 Tax=Cellulosilyticum lentocellum (strain ATCC 49066 / DSM 5427 / NCIMB 11756 / RHM5) TaxID=642492 RepID=F2JJW9_CELLD|nr:hypothetical protein Clole_1525 [Cellulosilyticum lentocellum DSM 5427]